jgi:hypothetical protein
MMIDNIEEVIVYGVRYPLMFGTETYYVFEANKYSEDFMLEQIGKQWTAYWSTTANRELMTIHEFRKRYFEDEFGEEVYVWENPKLEFVCTKIY